MYAKDNHATGGSHINCPPGCLIANRYEVVRQAGTGNFARVFECIDRNTNDLCAVKLLKKGYERDADFECDILRAINKHDNSGRKNVVKLLERSTWNNLAMIVFNLKGKPLRNVSLPMCSRDIAIVARDVGDALSFLHFKVHCVHTDLKPENVLAELRPSAGGSCWSICDLGSASFYSPGRLDSDLITTRPYRAPEVVMSKGWTFPADAWSLGCILYELRTGRKLFDVQTDADHMMLMEQRLGEIPGAQRFMGTRRAAMSSKPRLAEELSNDHPDFVDLLLQLLHPDPSRRMKCSAIATHPFVRSRADATAAESNNNNNRAGNLAPPSLPSSSAPSSRTSSLNSRGGSNNDLAAAIDGLGIHRTSSLNSQTTPSSNAVAGGVGGGGALAGAYGVSPYAGAAARAVAPGYPTAMPPTGRTLKEMAGPMANTRGVQMIPGAFSANKPGLTSPAMAAVHQQNQASYRTPRTSLNYY